LIDLSGAGRLDRDPGRDDRGAWRHVRRAQTRLERVIEAGSAGARMGEYRADKISRERQIRAVARASLREIGEAKVAPSLFCCAPAKRIRISRLEHVFDL
jgi:hypothetical protein